jgi:hypothetical protein
MSLSTSAAHYQPNVASTTTSASRPAAARPEVKPSRKQRPLLYRDHFGARRRRRV